MARRFHSARAAGKVSIAVFVSRILGLVRDQIFAKLFGANLYNDAWQVAFRIPNLLRDLFAEGALASAFVPTFTEFLKKKGRAEAWLLANLVISGLLILLGALALILLVFSDLFVYLLAFGFTEVPEKLEVTSVLIKILSPFLMLIAVASVGMGMLNTLNQFFLPALAPAFFNISLILAGVFLAPQFENWGFLPIHAMAVGALVGGFLQYAVQVPLLRKHGYRFKFRVDFAHDGMRRIGRLIAPAVVGVSAVQINVLVNTQLASLLAESGPVSWLSYAFRIIYLPIGLFGVAVGVVNLREVSAFATQEKWVELKETVANSIKLVSLLTLPSTVGLILLAPLIVDVLFERGEFTARDTMHTAYAVAFYSLGLFAYSCIKIYVPTFYALQDTRTPMQISIMAVVLNVVLNIVLILVFPAGYKYVGLALGTALSVSFNCGLLALNLKRRLGSFERYGIASAVFKTLSATVVMGVVVYSIQQVLEKRWAPMDSVQELVALALCMGFGIVVYIGSCHLLGVEEIRYLFARFKRI